jgi:hypothetical protein
MRTNTTMTMGLIATASMLLASGIAVPGQVQSSELCVASGLATPGLPASPVTVTGRKEGVRYNLTVHIFAPGFPEQHESVLFPDPGLGNLDLPPTVNGTPARKLVVRWSYDESHITPLVEANGGPLAGHKVESFSPINYTQAGTEIAWWRDAPVGLQVVYSDPSLGGNFTESLPMLGQAFEAALRTRVSTALTGPVELKQLLQQLAGGCLVQA